MTHTCACFPNWHANLMNEKFRQQLLEAEDRDAVLSRLTEELDRSG